MLPTIVLPILLSLVALRGDAPEGAVLDWLRQEAVPLTGCEPGKPDLGLAALQSAFTKARVIGLGEATQGSHEFLRLKHKLVESLVANCGVTTIAMETSWPETMALDHWVQSGEGNAKTLLADLHFWNVDTEEILAFVTWLRAWNADPSHARKVRLVGVDVQLPAQSVAGVAEFLAHVAPEQVDRFIAVSAPLSDLTANMSYPRLAPADQDAVRAGLDEFAKKFDDERSKWVAASSDADCSLARRALEMVRRAEKTFRDPAYRDQAMAEGVRDALTDDGPDARVAFWSHNVHVAAALPGSPVSPTGQYLRTWFGAKYLAMGFEFGRGAFVAVGPGKNGAPVLREFTLPAAPVGSVPAILDEVGKAVYVVDLRRAPTAGPVRAWLDAPARAHSIGGVFDPGQADAAFMAAPIAAQFDVIAFVRRTLSVKTL